MAAKRTIGQLLRVVIEEVFDNPRTRFKRKGDAPKVGRSSENSARDILSMLLQVMEVRRLLITFIIF